MSDRDYQSDMLAAIRRAVPKRGGWVASSVADKLVASLEEKDNDLLRGWLAENSRSILTDYIGRVMTHRPTQTVSAAKSAFNKALDSGSAQDMSRWLSTTYSVDNEFTRKRLGEMTKDDCLFVSSGYEQRAKDNKFEAIFFEALARRTPKGKIVEDVLSEKQIENIREGISV